MAFTLSLIPLADLPESITASLQPQALPAPVERTIAPFGPAYALHAFPIDLPDADKGTADKTGGGSSPGGRGQGGARDMGDRKKNVKLEEADLQEDWYALLKLENGEGASDEQIRGAYRRRCLETHPDKQPDGSDLEFKRVQRAFEILGNPEARRSYDSSRPFDDSIPAETVPEAAFFATFAPVFERNKKWSATPDMPSIGDDETPLSEVRKFYDSWLGFHTWRDFSNEVELQEIDEGMMREEKRWYQRQNQRLLDKMNKEELKRVRTLVERAMKNDPRLRRQREAEDSARREIQEQREAARLAAAEAERKAKDDAAEAERKAKEDERQRAIDAKTKLKDSVKDLADFFKTHDLVDATNTNKLLAAKVRKPNVQWVLQNATPDEAGALRDAVLGASPAAVAGAPPAAEASEEADAAAHVPAVLAFNLGLKAIEKRVGRNRYGEAVRAAPAGSAAPAAAAAAPAKKEKEVAKWTDEDIIMLQKLAIKFPGGCVDRWRHIALNMHNKFTEEQILEQTKNIETGWKSGQKLPSTTNAGVPDAPAAPREDEWTAKQQRQLEQGLRDLQAYKEKDKFTKIAAMVEGKSAKQCFDRFKHLCALRKAAGGK